MIISSAWFEELYSLAQNIGQTCLFPIGQPGALITVSLIKGSPAAFNKPIERYVGNLIVHKL